MNKRLPLYLATTRFNYIIGVRTNLTTTEMKCRQETVAEGDRVKSTEELHCAAIEAYLIGVGPD